LFQAINILGIALLFYKLHKAFGSENVNWLDRASQLLTKSEKAVHGHKPSFLCGISGPLACRAAVSYRLGDVEKSKQAVKSILKLADLVVEDTELPDELLFGRAGYLYSLLFVTREIDRDAVSGEVVTQVVEAIIGSGKKLASQVKSSCPLMYMWHESYYLGAAHGLAGIFFQLMRSPMIMSEPNLRHMVEQSVEYLMKLRLPSGNYPSSLHSREKDKLIHWCHGAPGFLHMFLQAFEVYGKETYILEAQSCADVIWQRGMLRKGYGLCHGVAGNGYGFLMLYKRTRNLKYLYRALKVRTCSL
uniref:LanC-like protein 2 n=1 Tax=Soboliphyme baturini TaxID=241478 RepID=A0A183IXE9_9BILA